MSNLSVIGDNKPPSQIDFANGTAETLGDWLREHPVVTSEDEARDGKLLVDRARLALQDLEDDRKAKTNPLYRQIAEISDKYRSPKSILEKILTELKERLYAWVKKEEESRRQAAEEARKRAEEAEQKAREAEEREREAANEARLGVEVDLAARTRDADRAFLSFQAAERDAARAADSTKVKIPGGFSKALSPRFKEELIVADPVKAVAIMGWSDRLLSALLTDAREYRRKHERLPDGIVARGERRL